MLSSLNRLQRDTLILSGSVPGCLIQSAQTRQPHYTCLSDSKKASSDRRLQNRDQSKETRRDDGCKRNKQLSRINLKTESLHECKIIERGSSRESSVMSSEKSLTATGDEGPFRLAREDKNKKSKTYNSDRAPEQSKGYKNRQCPFAESR